MTLAWVIGRGGLLGSAISRALAKSGTREFVSRSDFAWLEPTKLQTQMQDAATAFALAAADASRWEIYWAAGVGTMTSIEADLVPETRALAALLAGLRDAMLGRDERRPSLRGERGMFALASSAGAIYAGSTAPLISETVGAAPTSPYALAKLDHETMIARAAGETGVAAFVARFSTLYGVGQSKAKAQGLLTHISRCIVRNRALQIFVPLDTIRDYIAADDAAAMLLEASRQLAAPGRACIKIIASEQPATIGEILSIFKRIARRPPRIITSVKPSSSIYTRRMQFASCVPPLVYGRPRTPLLVGISRVLEAERALYVAPSADRGPELRPA